MALRSLSAIGFACRSHDELLASLAVIIEKQTETVRDDDGVVRIWRAASGAEIVFRYRHAPLERRADDARGALADLMGLSPFHHGRSAVAVSPLASLAANDEGPRAGLWHVALAADRHTGLAPEILVEMVPFQALPPGAEPARRHLQIVGFCFNLLVFADVADYFRRMRPQLLVAPGSIVPAAAAQTLRLHQGTVGQSAAMITGVIAEARRLANPVTGLAYQWLLVDTERGRIDLVAPFVPDTQPAVPGALICAHADLTGRLTDRKAQPAEMPVMGPVLRNAAAATPEQPLQTMAFARAARA